MAAASSGSHPFHNLKALFEPREPIMYLVYVHQGQLVSLAESVTHGLYGSVNFFDQLASMRGSARVYFGFSQFAERQRYRELRLNELHTVLVGRSLKPFRLARSLIFVSAQHNGNAPSAYTMRALMSVIAPQYHFGSIGMTGLTRCISSCAVAGESRSMTS